MGRGLGRRRGGGPLIGGVLVDLSGWQGLFWIDAAVAAACVPVTLRAVEESRDPNRSRSIDLAGTVVIAVVLVPPVLALRKGAEWGWGSVATIGCLVVSAVASVASVAVERRVSAPLVDLRLLRNRVLVGATLAILLVAGAINALMYVPSLYFQNPDAFGMGALEAGLATLPAAAAMILVTPLITPVAVTIGPAIAVALGFALAAVGFGVLAFVGASWAYAAFVLPLIAVAVGLGFANGPASVDGVRLGRRGRRRGRRRARAARRPPPGDARCPADPSGRGGCRELAHDPNAPAGHRRAPGRPPSTAARC